MSYSEHLHEMSKAMARLAVRKEDYLFTPDLEIALTARSAVSALLRQTSSDITGLSPEVGSSSVATLVAHPVAAFVHALSTYPQVPSRVAPSEVYQANPRSDAGRRWQQVARHATLAAHTWQTGRRSPTAGPSAWAGVADLAALAVTLSALDRDLTAASAHHPDYAPESKRLGLAVASGLDTIAQSVLWVATAGPLPEVGPEAYLGPNRTVIAVRNGKDLVAAQHQLVALLHTAPHIRPERIQTILVGHARALERATSALAGHPLAGVLARHRDRIVAAIRRPAALASIEGGDPAPLRQAQALTQGLAHLGLAVTEPSVAGAWIEALGDTTRALSQVVNRHLRSGAWLVPSHDDAPDRPIWARAGGWYETPHSIQMLRAAAVDAEHLHAPRPESPTSGQGGGQPQRTPGRWLVSAAARAPNRPFEPSQPLSAALRR